jgi:NAD+ synthase (glutamine-hydrolysing)
MMKALKDENEYVRSNVARLYGAYHEGEMPNSAQDLCNTILHTTYFGMAKQSSKETRDRAARLAKAIGSYHLDADIDQTFLATKDLLKNATGFETRFKSDGGSASSSLSLQNIQARSRMVASYYFAQTLTEVRGRTGKGSLLVLSSGKFVDFHCKGVETLLTADF